MSVGKVVFCIMLLACVWVFGGCTTTGSLYYNNSVGADFSQDSFETVPAENLTPVIFVHGLLGSELWDKSQQPPEQCWGLFSYGKMASSDFYQKLALPILPGKNSSRIVAGDILSRSRISLLGISGGIDNYANVLKMLETIGYRRNNNRLFVYAYDWRRSIDENAAALALFVQEKRALLESLNRQAGTPEKSVRFDLIGHSMGGLLVRYYVQYGNAVIGSKKDNLPSVTWAGARNVRKVIMVASPHGGYADTILEINRGLKLASLAPVIPGCVLATFPSYYQMLPGMENKAVKISGSGESVDILDIAVWKKFHWGLLNDDAVTQDFLQKMLPDCSVEQRRAAALEYTAGCLEKAGRFKLLMSRSAGLPPEPVRFYSLASSGMLTNSQLSVDSENGSISVTAQDIGDGKVALQSAHPEHIAGASPVFLHGTITLDGGHVGLMRGKFFARNLVHLLQCEAE